jgi:AraC-like DNA-binding protein
MSLVRDTAFDLFNLEVDLGDAESPAVSADIRVTRAPLASAIDVTTSWSIVHRTNARARAAVSNNVLLYLVEQGGSRFENARGEQFQTQPGSIVVGSQDAAYRAVAAPGKDWRFHALSMPEHLLALSRGTVRDGGFQLVPAEAALGGLLASFVTQLCRDFAKLDAAAMAAALKALDHLLSTSLGRPAPPEAGLAGTVAGERLRAALRYIEDNLGSATLSPEGIAAHLCVSPRQMHRVFEAAGKTVAAEVRRIRLARAAHLLQACPRMPVTDVAFACGFESLATFYRCFKAEFRATASDVRASAPH